MRCALALATIISGPYTGTYNAVDVGITREGFRLRRSVSKQLITGDAYGDSVIDGVYRGGNCFLTYVGIEYSDAIAVLWPYGATKGTMGQVGRLDVGSTIADATVLTAVAGTTAATVPATLTASQSILAEDYNDELRFAAIGREVPLSLRLYPYDNTGSVVWFTET